MEDKSKGSVVFALELDEVAASAIRQDSYQSQSLSKFFRADELKDAGFSVSIQDNVNGDSSSVEIKADFKNEQELKNILAFLAPNDVLNVELISSSSLIRDSQDLRLEVDLERLRKSYLEDDQVKVAIEKSGIKFSEFENLVNDAMKSTTLKIKLESSSNKKAIEVSGIKTSKESVELSGNSLTTTFLLNLALATLFGSAGLILIWRIRRTPGLLSNNGEEAKS